MYNSLGFSNEKMLKLGAAYNYYARSFFLFVELKMETKMIQSPAIGLFRILRLIVVELD